MRHGPSGDRPVLQRPMRLHRSEVVAGYTVRDLRPKALTDEAENAGGAPTNKGAHRTEQMRRHYVKKKIPIRVRNTLKPIRGD